MDWLNQAACADADPDLFFPSGGAGRALHDRTAAKRICARCPVRGLCLAWAMSTRQATGVWGGTCEEERAVLRRQSRR
ncbi:WhiB family transcriptional regulator [Streptomyces formicae]|uniref:Transcriptional regulator WhiB n=1 Tax=Streptomyces formicae TaxID=1616117 RepID=A0A291Q3B2_9ACTN|nr:WhiB family transcriptional regulator [Streptomyces formicae]ATL25975.1 WhiB-like transcription regulator [Streptomyces formicae]